MLKAVPANQIIEVDEDRGIVGRSSPSQSNRPRNQEHHGKEAVQ